MQVENLGKSFGPTRAVWQVGFTLLQGEVLALIGENGAGKSTVVKMLTGLYAPDQGRIILEGQPQTFHSPQDAWKVGISAIHQETVMFDELSVAENLFMGRYPLRAGGLVDWRALLESSRAVLARIDAPIDPTTLLRELSVAQKHLVQIARALSQEAQLVIMDEPTAALSRAEIEDLYRVVRQLRQEGKAILLITHKFDEIYALADRYVVLRDGEKVGEGRIADTESDQLVRLMAGREVGSYYPKRQVERGEVVLEVEGLSHPTEFADISFSVRKGEILGFYGLVGAGRSEVMQALFGLSQRVRGRVRLGGELVRLRSPADALRVGLAYVPEDRQHHGAILSMSILHNLSLPSLKRVLGGWWLRRPQEEALALAYTERLALKAAHLDQWVAQLSGGNQQKVVIGKWLATQPRVIIMDEPTKGIDVGAKAAVHRFMSELVEQGLAVILVSSELPEVLHMADRIVVMREGRLVGEFEASQASQEEIVARAAGVVA